jgi:thiol-disulfide isomerase/thioredoxin
MKSALLCLLILSCVHAQGQHVDGPFSLSPEHPKIGTAIEVTYRGSSPGAQLKEMDAIELHVLVFRYAADPLFVSAPMKKEGANRIGSIRLTDQKSCYMMFRCVSADKADDGGDKAIDAMVYGDDGKPVIGAHEALGLVLSRGQYNSFKRTKDDAGAREEFGRELELYPQNWRASNDLLNMAYRKDQSAEGKAKLKPEVDTFSESFRDNQEAVSAIVGWYKTVGDTAAGEALEKAVVTKDPGGVFARQARWSHIFDEKNASRRAELIGQYLKDNPNLEKDDLRNKMVAFMNSCLQAKKYDQAYDVLSRIDNPSWQWYNQIAWPLIEKGENLDNAVAWARRGVELSKPADPNEKRYSATLKEWEQGHDYNMAMILDTYAYGLLKLGRTDEAEQSSAEAFRLTKGEETEIANHYMECLITNRHFDKAYEVGMDSFKKGKNDEAMLAQLKTAYAEREASTPEFGKLPDQKQKAFGELLADLEKSRSEKVRKHAVEDRINLPSIDFTIKGLDGTPVSLASFKGKVVVIDFWATWCGPCKASFPYLQKVYEKYKDNPRVNFLAVDTWERQKDVASTVENARKFMADNKYTFPVLIDELTEKRVSEKYEVEGIPTKFIIDKKGNIAFKGIGFGGPEMEDELTAQIELLLGETM